MTSSRLSQQLRAGIADWWRRCFRLPCAAAALRTGLWSIRTFMIAKPGNAVGQAVMNAGNHAGAIALQAPAPGSGPTVAAARSRWVLTIFDVSALRSASVPLRNVTWRIWLRMSNLGSNCQLRQTDIERRKRYALAVARDQRQLRFDQIATRLERDRAFKHADARDAQRLAWALDVEEQCISPGERIVRLLA